jgi:predicted DNA-binding transcriptional regulator AlpA
MQANQTSDRAALESMPWNRVGICRAYAYELMARGEFPRPLKIGRASRFLTSEIDAWIAARIAERDTAARGTGE